MAWHQFTYLNFYVTVIVHDRFVLVVLRIFLAMPRSRLKTYGDKPFSAVAPRGVTSVDQFRMDLKTYLFKLAYDV